MMVVNILYLSLLGDTVGWGQVFYGKCCHPYTWKNCCIGVKKRFLLKKKYVYVKYIMQKSNEILGSSLRKAKVFQVCKKPAKIKTPIFV